MNNIVLTAAELEICKSWLLNKKNKEIASNLGVSESYVSQTIKKVKEKMDTLKSSVKMFEQLGLIEPITPLRFTDEGKKNFVTGRIPLRGHRPATEIKSARNNPLENFWKLKGVGQIPKPSIQKNMQEGSLIGVPENDTSVAISNGGDASQHFKFNLPYV
jgi:DNA-binding CsgD family transcriptional regulator